jgi:predicted O-linked N-acetylglucosamine transferase (SPINDLY family)
MTTEQSPDPDDLCDIAEEHHQAGRVSEAEAFYRKALQLDPEHPGALYFLGGITYEDGRYEQAFDLVNQLVLGDPADAEGLHLLGLIAFQQGKGQLALDCIGNALALQPNYVHAHYSLGETLLAQNQIDQAEISFQRALALNPQFVETHCKLGSILITRKKFAEAAAHYRQAIALNPEMLAAHSYLAASLRAQGLLEEAVASYRHALSLSPNAADVHYSLGDTLHTLGRLDAATDSFAQATSLKPDFAMAHYKLASTLKAQDRLDEAIGSYQRTLALQPDFAIAHMELGAVQQCQGRLDEAIASYQRAIALQPDIAELHSNLALALQEQGKLDAAAASYRQSLALRPDSAILHHDLAVVLHSQQLFDEATASFQKAIALNPDNAQAHSSFGLLLNDQGKLDEALARHQQSISLQPKVARAHLNLGFTLHLLGKYDKALESYQQALALEPDYPEAHNNIGTTLRALNNIGDAITHYRKALILKFDYPGAHLNLGSAYFDLGYAQEAIDCFKQVYTLNPASAGAFSDYLMTMQYLPKYTQEHLFAEHLAFAKLYETPLRSDWPLHTRTDDGPRRLRLGFVSGDLCMHPVGCFLERVLDNIDREIFDITLYSTSDRHDVLTKRLQAMELTWVSLFRIGDVDAAARIRDDRIDILVDLSGHTGGNRPLVFARKPAPVQVTWLGYWATTGLRAMDYILCDRHDIPGDEAGFYVEKPWYLPHTRMCFAPPVIDVALDPPPALGTGQVTFGCFNNLTKMNDTVVALWARILRAVPGSRLFLKSNALSFPTVHESVLARFAARGVAADRLRLEGKSAYDQYFAAYKHIDIALDPFPFTGGATSFDALWAGVPVITLRGDRLIARQGENMLRNLGMSDWVAADEEAYVALAVARANDLPGLADLRTQLRRRILQSRLCDAAQFARNLEDAFQGMWKAYCEKN